MTIDVSRVKLMQNVTMTVRLKDEKQFAVRQWVAIRLITLAARVLNCGLEVDLQKSA